MTNLNAALDYARHGFRVFPLHTVNDDGTCSCGDLNCANAGKHPRTQTGFKQATMDDFEIRRFWTRWPDANIGIATSDGLGVIDVDPRAGGDESVARLERDHDRLPNAYEVATGGGGRHLYVRVPEGTRSRTLAQGVDFKAEGGYVVAPPSRHASGNEYVLVSAGEIPPAPEWLLTLVHVRRNGSAPLRKELREGERNAALASIAGSLRNKGLEREEIEAALSTINETRCEPPLAHEEVARIAESIARYEVPDRSFPYTDYGNAERLVDAHGDDLLHVAGVGWHTWDGKRFQRDDDGAVERLMKQRVRAMYAEAAQMQDPDDRERHVKHALRSEAAARLHASIDLAKSERPVIARPSDLDAHPFLLNVANGTLDLRTAELREHRRGDRLTKITACVYVEGAESDLWRAFLARIFGDDEDLISFARRAVGYSLTASTSEEVLFFAHGPAATGKSTFIEAIKACLGDYAATADFETFLKKHGDASVRPDIARLAGRRFVSSIEVEEGKRLAEGLVKQVTGGDTVTARFLYREAFEFAPQFKLWLGANARPHVRADDAAMWRRILQLPFVEVIPTDERDPSLKRRLKHDPTAQTAILTWAVDGCVEWQETGLNVPARVREYTEEYRQENDPFGQWFDDCCILDAHAFTTSADLRQSYEAWAHEVGATVHKQKALAQALKERGCESGKDSRDRRGWRGIRVTNIVRVSVKGEGE